MSKQLLTITISSEELTNLEAYCQQTQRTKSDVISEYISSLKKRPRENLISEISKLSQELKQVKQEKRELETLLESTNQNLESFDQLANILSVRVLKNQAHFQGIIEAIPTPILVSDLDSSKIIYANHNASETFGFPLETLTKRSIWGCYNDILEGQKLAKIFQQNGEIRNYEICCCKADHSTFWAAVSLCLLELDEQRLIVTVLWNISDRKHIEIELQQAKEQLEAVLGAIPGYVSWVDNKGHYLGVNAYLADTFNLDPRDFVGQELGFMEGGKEFAIFIQKFIQSTACSASRVVEISIHGRTKSYLVVARKYKQNQETVLVGIDITEHQQAETALQQTNDQLKAVIDAVPGLVSWFDHEGYYLGINQHLADKFNLTVKTFIGQKLGFIEGSSQFSEFIYDLIASPHMRTSKVVEIIIQGELRYYLIDAQKYQQSQAVVCIGIDITEHKKAQLALRESEERFRSLVANIPGAIYRCQNDLNHTIKFISEAIFEISGYPAADFINNHIRTYNSIIHSEDLPTVASIVKQAISNHQSYSIEYRIIHQNGQIHWVYEQGRGVFNDLGELLYLDGAIFDITDKKQTQEALIIVEENYRSIFENALEGIFQSSPDGYYLRVNPAMARIYGYNSPDEMINDVTNIKEQIYVDNQGRDKFKQQLQENNVIKNWEYQVYRRDGMIIWVEEHTRVVRNREGTILYYEGIIQDITERKEKEVELNRQLEELRIEIDHQRREQDVAKITTSDYFQELKLELEQLRQENFFDD